MKNIWVTSDTHFNHKNVIKYCNRPYKDVDEMNQSLIKNWNSCATPQDDIYHLGDFCFGDPSSIIYQLNGNIFLVPGNHDHRLLKWLKKNTTNKIKVLDSIYEFRYPLLQLPVVMCHYPLETWNRKHYGSIHLHGHAHGQLNSSTVPNRLDVGVDPHNYTLISLASIRDYLGKE